MGIVDLVIPAIVICAIVGIGMVAVRASGVQIPQWLIQIATIALVAVVAIWFIKIVLHASPGWGMIGGLN